MRLTRSRSRTSRQSKPCDFGSLCEGFHADPAHPWLENVIRECVLETGHGPWIIFDSFSSLLPPGEGGESTGQVAPIYAQIRRFINLDQQQRSSMTPKNTILTLFMVDEIRKRRPIPFTTFRFLKINSAHRIQSLPWNLGFGCSPEGIGTFTFEVITRQDKKGKWHLSGLQIAPNPAELLAQRGIVKSCVI